ncbi:suppressor of cytokine signaling 7 isoform X2 [Lissotriton helveticus]
MQQPPPPEGRGEPEAAPHRALSRLLGCGEERAGPSELPHGSRPQLMVFRSGARGAGEPEDEGEEGGGGGPELCPRHRLVLGQLGAEQHWGPGLELRLGALELKQCPCQAAAGPDDPAEETSDALLVLEGPEAASEEQACRLPLFLQPPEPVQKGRSGRVKEPGRLSPRPGGSARKSSLKIRLSRLFRTKSCNGSGEARGTTGDLSSSAVSLTDVCGTEGRKPRLTRTQSAFSPVSFSPLFTGETVSLVDVDISQRGLSSLHPPTPPPPPRRSLSLLDAFPRVVPSRPTETIQSQLVQQLQCPLYRQDSSSFAASLRELEKCGWYWGPMNWEDAEMKLKGKPDGSFLVRDSSDPRYILSLSFRSQGITHHTRMEHYRGTFSLWCHPKFEDRCQSVVEFIKRAIMHSKNGKFLYFLRSRVPGLPPTPVQLLYPVSRFSNVKSLQHLCRFRIRQLVRIDHIPELPLPKPLISYLRKFYYYDPQEEVYLSLKEARLVSTQEQESESST